MFSFLKRRLYVGIVLLTVGVVFTLEKHFGIAIQWSNVWPIILMVIGLLMVITKR